MSFRDRVKTGGGGWLNNVDARIVGYQFVIGETKPRKSGKRKGEPFTPLSLVPEFLQEGASEPISQRLLIGDAADFGDVDDPRTIVSEDGLTLLTSEALGSEAGTFINSLLDADDSGQIDARLAAANEAGDSLNLEPIIGTRVQLIQEPNEAKTKAQGQQIGKDGKGYDRKDLKVSAVHELPDVDAKPAKGKAGAKTAPTVKGKPSKADEGARIAEKAGETLRAILSTATDQTIKQSNLSMAVLKALGKDEDREAVRKYLTNSDNLEAVEGITFRAKTGTLTLDE